METESLWVEERLRMVKEQIEQRGIRDQRVLQAMREVPRHLFVPEEEQPYAYEDCPLSIGFGQTISQPYMVAIMTALLELKGDEKVLEVGTGSGYQAAILSRIVREVHTIERHPVLAQRAEERLRTLGYSNVKVYTGDGSLGLPDKAPFQGIVVTAAAPKVPAPLLQQLALNAYLVIPVGGPAGQELMRLQKTSQGVEQEELFPVAFVPLRGKEGWKDSQWFPR
jgi:protein-L-isoaspartate(D-aspartate) O-methyltransferase